MDPNVEVMWNYFLKNKTSVKNIRRCNVDDGALLQAAAILTAGHMIADASKPKKAKAKAPSGV